MLPVLRKSAIRAAGNYGLTLRLLYRGDSVVARWEFGETSDEPGSSFCEVALCNGSGPPRAPHDEKGTRYAKAL
jgi:hypothetical protein